MGAMKGESAWRADAGGLATPTIVFHGDKDGTVHPSNGARLFEAAGDSASAVQVEEGRAAAGRGWTRRIKAGPDGIPSAEYWQVHGGAHAWSGGRPGGSYTDPRGPDATAEMLRFFWSHRRR
jgi:poly(3-hydroxybutyrate) depolymerase